MLHRNFRLLAAKAFHQLEMARNIAFRRREKITLRHGFQKAFDFLLGVIFDQFPAHASLNPPQRRAHILALELALFDFFQKIESFDVKLAQQGRLPGIPNFRPDGFDVGKCQQVEHF